MSKEDFLGNEIKLGDEVVFMQIDYRSLMKGKVIGMSDKTALISHEKTNTYRTESRQYYGQMVLIQNEKRGTDNGTDGK